ncbi:glutathione S-transferase N-terminal domain-containing protein [Sphingomonas sp. KRR8]|uniref:glutaredoxin domain-containing protein n=1 Tax=Sphingomonas sp. KRR8 TaxID=2942996 RepID=UPI0020201C88|nr:glutaredoxin domain-containing protein [Sphingomonas sp. KRR8]URD62264.1 glutathione S-transferase N-terminal domain-containing protein [Sphingomonas sp. KRR8]
MPSAVIYRMILPDHECPFGRRAKELLDENGFDVEEHILSSREEVEDFKQEHGVATTPLIWVDGEQIGGSAELEKFLSAHV